MAYESHLCFSLSSWIDWIGFHPLFTACMTRVNWSLLNCVKLLPFGGPVMLVFFRVGSMSSKSDGPAPAQIAGGYLGRVWVQPTWGPT